MEGVSKKIPKLVQFAIVLHFHQPVGNFKEVFERAYQRCYRPFLEHLAYYPDIRMTLHISGSLIDYFKKEHLEILKLLKDMVSKGRVELMGGVYYEPILIAIPPRDIKGQIKLMSKSLKDDFGIKTEGAWIPERVWRPDLAKHLHKSGIRYCVLDDSHLIKAGLKKEETYGYFLTKDKSASIAVFGSDKMLRYTIPFKEPQETIDYFKKVSQKAGNPLFVYADDAEKFGEWPGTYDWVYKKGWLKSFFDAIMKNREWIETVKLSDYLKSNKPLSAVRIPEASYEEMMEWAGGSWFNFLKKYPESNNMYKKMQYVSERVDKFQKKAARKDSYWAEVELYRGESNCGYWHGVFGGLYMYHLRSAIYNHLIAAENIVDAATRKKGMTIKCVDFDSDGKDEFILQNKVLSLYIDPKEGGTLKELDYRPICANLINTLSRKREKYHKRVEKLEPSLSEKLIYDRYTRYCLRDYFINEDLQKESFITSSFKDYGNFSSGDYIARKKSNGLILKRKSSVSGVEVELTKELSIKGPAIEILYRIKYRGLASIRGLLFGTEFNLTMPFLNSPRYRYFSDEKILDTLNTSGIATNADSFSIRDSKRELDVKFEFSKRCRKVWYFPIETISQAQTTYRANFQSSCILPLWKPDFDKDGIWSLKIIWFIKNFLENNT